MPLVLFYGMTVIPGRTRRRNIIVAANEPLKIPKKPGPRLGKINEPKPSNLQYLIDCPEKIHETYAWAKYVIFFGLLGVVWLLAAAAVFCSPIGPGGKGVVIIAASFITIMWTIFSLAAPGLLFKAFFFAFRSAICEIKPSES